MAELLVKAEDATHPDPATDQKGCYKRGMPVVVMDDDHPWGLEERLPKFVVIKLPLIPVERVLQYIQHQNDAGGVLVRRRLWQLQWNDLPAAARTKLLTEGLLVIKASAAYTGPFDYTWAQVRTFLKNLATGLSETADL